MTTDIMQAELENKIPAFLDTFNGDRGDGWRCMSRELASSLIGQFGGSDVFVAQYKAVIEDGNSDKFTGFDEDYKMLSFSDRHQKALIKHTKECAYRTKTRTAVELIADQLSEKGLDADDVAEGLHEGLAYFKNSSNLRIEVWTWIVWFAAVDLCHNFTHYLEFKEL